MHRRNNINRVRNVRIIVCFMKTFLIILSIFLAAGLVYLWLNPKENKVEIPHVEYRDSPAVDSLKNVSKVLSCKIGVLRDSLKKYAYVPVYIKGDTIYRPKDRFVHDTIYLLMNDIISYQDSIITTKDSIIYHMTTDLKAMNDSVYYFRTMYIDEKTKKKKWRLVAVGSGILNILMFLKR